MMLNNVLMIFGKIIKKLKIMTFKWFRIKCTVKKIIQDRDQIIENKEKCLAMKGIMIRKDKD